MSCRVLKRDMELAMLDSLVVECQKRGIEKIKGCFRRTPKNDLVADHYSRLGFQCTGREGDEASFWVLELENYEPRNRHIKEITNA